ncbi:aspartate aminotransferase family protein [Bacteroides timonensis]|uniref:hypothetical protein n=1 Tax=Bacteroides timonensis TaxID=1470345 RepID=UPI0004B7AA59|nr:hypothetical protein [Bacteroides timonensis]
MMKAIGGYFSWEFPMTKIAFPHDKGVLVNSGHGALQLILQNIGRISKLWIPYFTCDIVPDALKAIGVVYEFYHLNFDLEIGKLPELKADEYLLYTNYFGVMDSYVLILANYYGDKLIIDNAQAFFTQEFEGCHQIYSPRKFVGVPDGGIAVSPLKIDISRLSSNDASGYCSHLILRGEGKVTEGYELFKSNDNALRDFPLAKMSQLTQNILHSLDYQQIIEVRKKNYSYLHSNLETKNGFVRLLQKRDENSFTCPMVYPFYTNDVTLRSRLMKNNIFVAQYWPNILEWCSPMDCEYALCNHIVPIPVDQRYGEEEMNRIIEIVKR